MRAEEGGGAMSEADRPRSTSTVSAGDSKIVPIVIRGCALVLAAPTPPFGATKVAPILPR
jgi:hypothetical protein